jgi:hypothetical protein
MILGSPEHVNERMSRQERISHPADVTFFNNLIAGIAGLTRPGEQHPVPDVNEIGAWRKAYSLYEALKLRESQTRTKAATDLRFASFAAEMNRAWTDYNSNVTWLREFEGRNRGEWKLLTEWVGITEDDLSDPVPRAGSEHAQYGRFPDWQERAGRVAEAVHKFRGLKPEERAEVPRIVEERRRLAILKAHDTDIASLFDVVRQLAQRLEALESRLPPQKEVISAMVA